MVPLVTLAGASLCREALTYAEKALDKWELLHVEKFVSQCLKLMADIYEALLEPEKAKACRAWPRHSGWLPVTPLASHVPFLFCRRTRS